MTAKTTQAADPKLANPVLSNPAALAAWMDTQGLGTGAPLESKFLSGGSQNEIFKVTRGDVAAVLRIPPATAGPDRDAGIVREYRIIEGLDGTDVPHTAAVALCEDTSVLGRTFYLMGFVDGWSPMGLERRPDGPARWPEPFNSDIEQRRGLAFQLIEGIALLSNVDWRVRAHKPLDYIPGVMHGDYQFANVMFKNGAPARLAALVDWEMGTVGDPKLDLGWVINSWPEDTSGGDGSVGGYVDLTGMPSRTELLDHYSKVSGRQVDDIDYYNILARWKLATVLEQTYQRAGNTPKGAAFGPIVVDLCKSAADLAATTDYDYTG